MTDFQKWCQWVKPFVDAGAEGKEIEQENDFGFWIPKTNCGFMPGRDYRIKPTPKYRPFTLEESGVLLAGKVRHEDHGWATVECVTKSGLAHVLYASGGMASIDLATMLGRFTFADTGKPCGVLVEEGQ